MPEAPLLASVVLHTVVIYVVLVTVLATTGRQQMGQFTLVDYLIVALLGSAVETGLYLGSGSFWAGITSATTLLLANKGLRLLSGRVPRVHRFVVGSPILVVQDGQIVWPNLGRAHLTEQNLMSAVRSRGYERVDEVRFAVLEPNGSVGIVPREEKSTPPTR